MRRILDFQSIVQFKKMVNFVHILSDLFYVIKV